MSNTENVSGSGEDVLPEDTRPERERALEHLKKYWPEERQLCPICNTNDWSISDVAHLPLRPRFLPTPDAFARDLSGPSVYPLVPVSCTTCGYTFFFNEKWARGENKPRTS